MGALHRTRLDCRGEFGVGGLRGASRAHRGHRCGASAQAARGAVRTPRAAGPSSCSRGRQSPPRELEVGSARSRTYRDERGHSEQMGASTAILTESTVRHHLGQVLAELTTVVDQGKAAGFLREADVPVLKWRIKDATVNDGIRTVTGMTGERLSRRSWDPAAFEVHNAADQLPSVKASEKALGATTFMRSITDWFVMHASRSLLEDATRPSPRCTKLIDDAVSFCVGGPWELRSTLTISGVHVVDGPVVFATPTARVTLRTPEDADLEYEEDLRNQMMPRPNMPRAYATHSIGIIEARSQALNFGHYEAQRACALLRLYRVCSARYLSRDDEIVRPISDRLGPVTAGDREGVLQTCVLRASDSGPLERLASRIWLKIPPGDSEGPEVEPTPVVTAYRRYSDALVSDASVLERRYANAVMGLESLYVPQKQDGVELSYRLRMHVGRVMDLSGRDGAAVAKEVAFAYGVRSAHVHGSHFGRKLRGKADRDFGGPPALLLRILDYLRLSIVLALLSDLSKDEILRRLDEASYSEAALILLKQSLGPSTALLPQ
jgi:hypothetical protein